MSALRRLFELIVLMSVGAFALCAGHAESPAARDDALRRMAQLLEQRYVDEARGVELARMLQEAVQSRRFQGASDPKDFAQAVTKALQETVPDLHLRVTYEPDREFAPGAGADQQVRRTDDGGAMRPVLRTARLDGRSLEAIARSNFGVQRVENLAGNVGYLKITQFVPTSLSRDTLRSAFTLLANSDAVIVDLRGTPGGAPDAVAEVFSPFFAADKGPVTLHVAENRALGVRDEIRTDPSQSRARLVKAPLFVLVDGKTASAAEMFAYALKRAGRATLVGETTPGAGNGAAKHSVGAGYALLVPEWRVVSGEGWEGVGIEPHVAAESAQALDRALELAKAALAPKST